MPPPRSSRRRGSGTAKAGSVRGLVPWLLRRFPLPMPGDRRGQEVAAGKAARGPCSLLPAHCVQQRGAERAGVAVPRSSPGGPAFVFGAGLPPGLAPRPEATGAPLSCGRASAAPASLRMVRPIRLRGTSTSTHAHLHHVARLHHLVRVLHEAVGELARRAPARPDARRCRRRRRRPRRWSPCLPAACRASGR